MMTFAEVAIRTSIVVGAGLIVRTAVRHRSASLRHRVVAVTLLATAAVAPLSWLLPVWAVPVPALTARTAPSGADQSIGPTGSTSVASSNGQPARDTGLPLAATLWVLAAAGNGAVFLFGIARLGRLTRRARALNDQRWNRLAEQTCAEYGITRKVALLQTGASDVLATWGLVRPCLLLPRDAREWDDERVRIVLRHELAHVRRHDWIVQIGGEVVRSIYCFNPLVWIACRTLRRDSEHACDDQVIEAGTSPSTYATHLLELARICRPTTGGARPFQGRGLAMLMARPSTLERRIAAMLSSNIDRRSASRRAVATVAAVLFCIALPAALLRAAQTSPLPLKGSVYDPSGAVLPDVELMLEGANNTAVTARTDASGRFEFASIAPGRYVLNASLPAFKTLRYPLELRTARDWDRAITLQVGDLQESITVQAQRMASGGATASAQQPVRVGGNIRVPMKVHDVHPIYPASMRAAGREGVVPIEAIISRDGNVYTARVLSAQVHPDFAAAALDAVRQWRFTPTLLNGEPVEVVMTVSVTFRLAE
jgi:TonB family protein